MFNNYFYNFKKKPNKIKLPKIFKKNFLIYKSRFRVFLFKRAKVFKLKKQIKSLTQVLNFFKIKRFKVFYFKQLFNVKKKIFIKNRKTNYNVVQIKNRKNSHLNTIVVKRAYFYKNEFKSKLFWLKFKKPILNKFFNKVKTDDFFWKHENSQNLNRKLIVLGEK